MAKPAIPKAGINPYPKINRGFKKMFMKKENIKILGTSTNSIDLAEDRGRFQEFVNKLELKQPPNGIATNLEEAMSVSDKVVSELKNSFSLTI